MNGGSCFGGASDDRWSNQWRFAENPQQTYQQQSHPHAQAQQQPPSQHQHQHQQQQTQQWRFDQQQQRQQLQQPPVHHAQHHLQTPQSQMSIQQQKQMRHHHGQRQQQQQQLQPPHGHKDLQQEGTQEQHAWLDQSRRNRQGGNTRNRGSRRGRVWTAPEAPLPEDGVYLPAAPAWPACSAVAVSPGRGACALPESPSSFFVKIDVGDFYDQEDLNFDAPSCPGNFIATWESEDEDEELEPLESLPSFSPGDVAEKSFPCGGKHGDHGGDLVAHSGGSDHDSGGGGSGFDREEPEMRVKDIILQDIRGLLERCPLLQLADFDYRVRQHLHAMYGTGGRQHVIQGLESVRLAVHQKLRSSVRSWPGYVLALLKKSEY